MTAISHDILRGLLLDMISTTRPVDLQTMARLGEENWQSICIMEGQHRLGPILHHHCQTRGEDWIVPDHIRARWAAAFRKSAILSLKNRQALHKLHEILVAECIPYAALKGAWLSRHVFDHPAHRPMRDIDILVSARHAIPAFEALLRNGYALAHQKDVRPIEYTLEHHKHLPALKCPVSNRAIEVHSRLLESCAAEDVAGTIADTNALLRRCIRPSNADAACAFLSPTDTLLHLIVHSVYEHRFDNGPLVMNDIAAMLSKVAIDWDRFWNMAEAGGWTRGCQLLLATTRNYHDHIALPPHATTGIPSGDSVVEAAALMMLLDFEQSDTIAFRKETMGKSWSLRTIRYLWKRAVPARHQLAYFAGVPLDSRWLWMHFPAWAITRSRQVVFRRISADVHADAKRAAQVEHWMRARGSA